MSELTATKTMKFSNHSSSQPRIRPQHLQLFR